MRTSGRVSLSAWALEPIHHGAGASGNVGLLRTQDSIDGEGRRCQVPFVSGNSIKGLIRRAAAGFALSALEIQDGSLTKSQVDLLFAGGHLSRGGSAIDLAQIREIERLIPALSLCGYSAGNSMTPTKVSTGHLHLVCRENAWRLPDDARALAEADRPAGYFRGEEFGTRQDPGTSEASRFLTSEDSTAISAKKAKKLTAKKGKKIASDKDAESLQMIFHIQVLVPGSRLVGEILFEALSDLELAALGTSLGSLMARERGGRRLLSVGAKSASGFGLLAVEARAEARAPLGEFTPIELLAGPADDLGARYIAHLRENRAEILALLGSAA